MIQHKVTFVKIRRPPAKDLNSELQWLGNSLGLFGMRDKDKSTFRVFIEMVKAAKERRPLSSDEIAARIGLTRGTVVHHINKLINSGIVVVDRNRYILRVDSLRQLIDEMERDVESTCRQLRQVAEEIDDAIGLE